MEDYHTNPPYKLIYWKGYESLNYKTRWQPLVNEVLKYKKEGSVLDIGCAYGFFLRQMPDTFEKSGIDMSEVAATRAKKENPNAHIFNLSFDNFDLKIKYDIITCFETLEHLEKLEEALEKVYTLLNYDGYFIASFPITESWIEKKWFTMFDKTHINPSNAILSEIEGKFWIIDKKYTFDCVRFILLPRFRTFPVHQSYFIFAQKK